MLDARARLDQGIIFERHGHSRRALECYEAVAASTDEPATLAEALRRQSEAWRLRCEWGAALSAARRSAEVATSFGSSQHLAEALNAEAIVHQRRGDFSAALPLLRAVLDLATDDHVLGAAHQNLGSIAAMRRDFQSAQAHYAESRLCFRRSGYLRGEVIALNNDAAVANLLGDHEAAWEVAEQAMEAAARLEDSEALAHAYLNGARALAGLGRFPEAEDLVGTALGCFAVEENPHGRAACLRILGDVNLCQGERSMAEACYRQARRIAESAGALDELGQLDDRLSGLGIGGRG